MIEPQSIELTDFLVTWHGAPSISAAPLPASCDWLPEPLKDWHILSKQWDRELTHTTWMVWPEDIRIGDDGKAVFMMDTTADWCWCIDPNDPDAVFDAEQYDPLKRNPEQLTVFLIHNTVREALHGTSPRMWAFDISSEILSEILSPMEEIAFGAWNWPEPGYRTFTDGAMLAEIARPDSGSGWFVAVAASQVETLSRLTEISEAHWRTHKNEMMLRLIGKSGPQDAGPTAS
ncbi:hypothetical protein DP939_09310 [Spongiactinospora rosea]|uniref:Uncharacterized protein n=1 Tax=Spongiactinospora rosea TaxID=2248750 RepID=A0A366M350_9ACTN|nr:hypothetical protein [Spongiactinospora rosea]RBQ20019.1 hypothetical protein DP939_09310 [Spongiactinospora rosea]